MSDSATWRRRPPEPGELRPFEFPPFEERRLGRLRALVARAPDFGLTTIEVLVGGGATLQPLDRPGLTSHTMGMLDEGVPGLDASQIAERVESCGASLGTGCDWDACSLSIGGLTDRLGPAFDLLCAVIDEPTFPEADLERVRRQSLAELARRQRDPSSLAGEAFRRALYGSGAYGTALIGTPEVVSSLSREELVEHRPRALFSDDVALVVVGDGDLDQLLDQISDRLGGPDGVLGSRPAPAIELPAPEPATGVRVHVVDRPDAAQTELRIGHPGPPADHRDRPALTVLNSILGGKFTSRINLNLREEHGYTYGASSRFHERRGPGPFLVSTAVSNEAAGAAAREVLHEITRFQQDRVADEELDDARNYILGVFPYTLQTLQGVAGRLASLVVFGLPLDHWLRMPERIAAVDHEAVLGAARRHLRPSALEVVAVGPAKEIVEQFRGEPFDEVLLENGD